MAIRKLSNVGESIENIIRWQDLEFPGGMDCDLDLLPLGIDLKKLLVQVTGEKNIENVTRVKLKVVTKQAALHRLAEYTPRLKVLILDDSCVDSLRDLGSGLNCLETLSLARCGLKSLDGLWGFRNLKVLLARGNVLRDISICSGVDKLAVLDVAYNEIDNVSSFAYLKNCKHLRILKVAGNRFTDYTNVLARLVPQIRIIDTEEVMATENIIREEEKCLPMRTFGAKDQSRFSFSDDEISKVSATLIEINAEDSRLKKNDGAESRFRELGAGDERSIVSVLSKCHEINSEDDTRKIRAKEINLKPSSSSIFLMKSQFHTSPVFDPASNMGEYRCNLESMSNKLSSGRAVCGNLAASLRLRNSSKNPFTLAASRDNLQNLQK